MAQDKKKQFTLIVRRPNPNGGEPLVVTITATSAAKLREAHRQWVAWMNGVQQ